MPETAIAPAVLAIDPGPEKSAFVFFAHGRPVRFAHAANDAVRRVVEEFATGVLSTVAIEMIASYGMAVGAEVFQTCLHVGRFVEIAESRRCHVDLIYRREVKLHLCHSAKAKDGNIRQALVDRYGGKDRAIGRKANPGPLYGVSGDVWAALAVAVTWADRSVEIRARGA